MKAAVRRRIKAAAVPAAAAVLVPGTAWAESASDTAATHAVMGGLPLLAALAIGIAVAVGAVIAFLHMTAKDREPRESAAEWQEIEVDPDNYSDAPSERLPESGAEEEADEDDHQLTDYTIPMARIPAEPVSSEPTEDGEPRLCGVGGEFTGASFRMNGRGCTIGRDPAQCHIVFPLDIGEVSRRHCSLQFEEERRLFLLEDHGSSNGTFLPDGVRLQPGRRYELRSGERFSLSGGIHWFEVRV